LELRWYYAIGVSSLEPWGVWQADAGEYWVKEEYCEYTHPYNKDEEEAKYVELGLDFSKYEVPKNLFMCHNKDGIADGPTHDASGGEPVTRQCKWELQWSREDPAYKFFSHGFQCKRCPLYLPPSKQPGFAQAQTQMDGVTTTTGLAPQAVVY